MNQQGMITCMEKQQQILGPLEKCSEPDVHPENFIMVVVIANLYSAQGPAGLALAYQMFNCQEF